MVPKDKGWGMSNLDLWGKNPCVATLLCLSHLPLSTSLLFWGVVEELWLLVVGAVIVLGSGVAGLPVLCPYAHSIHDLPFTPLHSCLFTFTAALVDCHAGQWSVVPHAKPESVDPRA